MNPLGTHLLLDLRQCNPDLLDDLQYIKQAMMRAATEAGATVLGENFHKFNPLGVTGIIAISESHLAIHTWPEHGYAAVDIFTCGSSFGYQKAAQLIIERLECAEHRTTELKRGPMLEISASPVS